MRSLVRYLESDQSAVVTTLGESELEIGLVGSLNSHAQQKETALRLGAWTSSRPG
jgi:flagellar basal body-associated protein FliL